MFGNAQPTQAPSGSSGGLFGNINHSSNFTFHATGRAEIPFPAERALIDVLVSSSGTNQASVSDEVLTTAKHIETLLRELSPKDDAPESKANAALAHWSKNNLSSTSHVPWSAPGKPERPREYTASITFDIRFKNFGPMGKFGSRLTALPHVQVRNIDWIITTTTHKAHQSTLRREAARDALQQAQDYCEVLGCTNIRPVELNPGAPHFSRGLFGKTHGSPPPPPLLSASAPSMQSAPGMSTQMAQQAAIQNRAMAMQAGAPPPPLPPNGTGEELEFRPQEVRMSMEVSVKFHADASSINVGDEVSRKRARDDEVDAMEDE